ncbi:MAG: long-chain fatty acid--CoA ligase [Solirubrobacteraceae bacterium]|nr:long-chain fatty acid--CoA ligase [Solirubrobacteraceae bacterium]
MSTTEATSAVATMLDALQRGLDRHPDQILVRTKDGEIAWSWSDVDARRRAIAGGLHALGAGHGDCVGLMLANRPEFLPLDLGATSLGAVPVSIYQTSSPEQIAYIVGDAAIEIVITEQAFVDRVLAARALAPGIREVVVIDGDAPDGAITLAELEGRSDPAFDVEAATAAVGPDDLLTLIYTSGTTGPPKGVELTHTNLIAAMVGIGQVAKLRPGGRVISWLPAAHIAERGAHYYAPLLFGMEITTCADPRQIGDYLATVRPTWFFAVPRIWEKLKAGIEAKVAGLPGEQRAMAQAAIEHAREKVRLEQAGWPVPADIESAVAAAEDQLFAPLRATLGLDQAEAINVGAAPTSRDVIEFFHAIGVPVAEIWGMSEGCACGTLNPPARIKIGTVGPAVPGMQITLAEDGEVLLKGPTLMRGYRNLAEKTRESFTEDGWFLTGDIGELDEDGYLTIVDRKKELIINAAGKNMSPANIEATIKSAHPLIAQVAVIGDRRPYNVALIVLDPDLAQAWAQQRGIDGDLAAIAADARLRDEIQAGVDAGNASLSRVEQVKRFEILRSDWLPGGDELTPTMKLKRKPIDEKYTAEIDALYVTSPPPTA